MDRWEEARRESDNRARQLGIYAIEYDVNLIIKYLDLLQVGLYNNVKIQSDIKHF